MKFFETAKLYFSGGITKEYQKEHPEIMATVKYVVYVYISLLVLGMTVAAYFYEKYKGLPNVYVLVVISMVLLKFGFRKKKNKVR